MLIVLSEEQIIQTDEIKYVYKDSRTQAENKNYPYRLLFKNGDSINLSNLEFEELQAYIKRISKDLSDSGGSDK